MFSLATLGKAVALPRRCVGSARAKIVEEGGEPAVGMGRRPARRKDPKGPEKKRENEGGGVGHSGKRRVGYGVGDLVQRSSSGSKLIASTSGSKIFIRAWPCRCLLSLPCWCARSVFYHLGPLPHPGCPQYRLPALHSESLEEAMSRRKVARRDA